LFNYICKNIERPCGANKILTLVRHEVLVPPSQKSKTVLAIIRIITNACSMGLLSSSFKPSTHIDENRELTIGVSERKTRG